MAAGGDLTVKILREIRDEIRSTNHRLDQTNHRLEQTNHRLDQTNHRLDQTNERLDKMETTLLDLAQQQRFVVRYMKTLSERDSRLAASVGELRARVDALEKRANGRRR